MTEENRRANIIAEMERAGQALQAAQALVELALYADAVSRAYYAAFHCLRALLLTRGIEPKSHAGAIHLYNLEFVRSGQFPNTHNRLLGSLQRARELADYDAAVSFAPQDAASELDSARQFTEDTRTWLEQSGWWTPASKVGAETNVAQNDLTRP